MNLENKLAKVHHEISENRNKSLSERKMNEDLHGNKELNGICFSTVTP
jgi:hypothetical protein